MFAGEAAAPRVSPQYLTSRSPRCPPPPLPSFHKPSLHQLTSCVSPFSKSLSNARAQSEQARAAVQVLDFDTSETPAVTTAGALQLVRTTFENNGAADASPASAAPLLFGSQTALVALEETSFSANDGPPLGRSIDSPAEVRLPPSDVQTLCRSSPATTAAAYNACFTETFCCVPWLRYLRGVMGEVAGLDILTVMWPGVSCIIAGCEYHCGQV